MKHAALALAAALILTACGGREDSPEIQQRANDPGGSMEIITGGPCRYVESVFEADIVAVDDGQVELSGPEGETFYMQTDEFDATPAAGDRYTVKGERIIEGTCTPEIFTVLEAAEGGAD